MLDPLAPEHLDQPISSDGQRLVIGDQVQLPRRVERRHYWDVVGVTDSFVTLRRGRSLFQCPAGWLTVRGGPHA